MKSPIQFRMGALFWICAATLGGVRAQDEPPNGPIVDERCVSIIQAADMDADGYISFVEYQLRILSQLSPYSQINNCPPALTFGVILPAVYRNLHEELCRTCTAFDTDQDCCDPVNPLWAVPGRRYGDAYANQVCADILNLIEQECNDDPRDEPIGEEQGEPTTAPVFILATPPPSPGPGSSVPTAPSTTTTSQPTSARVNPIQTMAPSIGTNNDGTNANGDNTTTDFMEESDPDAERQRAIAIAVPIVVISLLFCCVLALLFHRNSNRRHSTENSLGTFRDLSGKKKTVRKAPSSGNSSSRNLSRNNSSLSDSENGLYNGDPTSRTMDESQTSDHEQLMMAASRSNNNNTNGAIGNSQSLDFGSIHSTNSDDEASRGHTRSMRELLDRLDIHNAKQWYDDSLTMAEESYSGVAAGDRPERPSAALKRRSANNDDGDDEYDIDRHRSSSTPTSNEESNEDSESEYEVDLENGTNGSGSGRFFVDDDGEDDDYESGSDRLTAVPSEYTTATRYDEESTNASSSFAVDSSGQSTGSGYTRDDSHAQSHCNDDDDDDSSSSSGSSEDSESSGEWEAVFVGGQVYKHDHHNTGSSDVDTTTAQEVSTSEDEKGWSDSVDTSDDDDLPIPPALLGSPTSSQQTIQKVRINSDRRRSPTPPPRDRFPTTPYSPSTVSSMDDVSSPERAEPDDSEESAKTWGLQNDGGVYMV